MEVGEREDCEGGTGGWEKGNGSKEAHGEPREEGDGVNKEERNGGGGGCVGGAGGGTEWRRKDKSEEGLLTLAVTQAICVAMLHVLLKGWSAGNRDIMVSSGKQARPCRLATPNKVTKL